jgi:hypothetical protein
MPGGWLHRQRGHGGDGTEPPPDLHLPAPAEGSRQAGGAAIGARTVWTACAPCVQAGQGCRQSCVYGGRAGGPNQLWGLDRCVTTHAIWCAALNCSSLCVDKQRGGWSVICHLCAQRSGPLATRPTSAWLCASGTDDEQPGDQPGQRGDILATVSPPGWT